METLDVLLRVLGVISTLAATYLLFKKLPFDNRASLITSSGNLLDDYNKLVDRLSSQDEKLRAVTEKANDQASEIKQLRRDIQLLEKHAIEALDYKTKWEQAVIDLASCRDLVEKQLKPTGDLNVNTNS